MTKKMVDEQAPSTDICRGQKLVVTVEEAQVDLLLVSYEHGTQVFQGVLLDSTKGRLPCGIYPPGGQFPPEPPKTPTTLENEDKLFSVKQRHTYYQQDALTADGSINSKEKKGVQLRRSISLTQRFKNSRMTVRLRPRQVLCSKCQSICNEKSENVSAAKGQRATEPPTTSKVTSESRGSTRSNRDRSSQDAHSSNSVTQRREREREREKCPQKSVMLVPKLVKLKPSEIEAATSKGVSCLRISPPARNSRSDSDSCDSEISVGSNTAYSVSGNNNNTDGKVPKLKLSTNLCNSELAEGKRKGRIPKMTINLALQASELSKENWTRNRLEEAEECSDMKSPGIPKMILSTSGVVSDQASDRKEKDSNKARKQGDGTESRPDAKELRLRSGNVHKLTINAAGHQSFSESDRVSPIPKLTILPVVPKKEEQEDQELSDQKHHKMGKTQEDSPLEKMSLRKKRSLGSMEDLWDESVFDETAKKHKGKEEEESGQEDTKKVGSEEKESIEGDKPKATPVLKISFGPEGKGTVLKIPSKSTVVTINTPEVETEEEMTKKYKDMSAKAAKKALKKAKKEAQKKAMLGGASPAYMMGGMSPRFGGMSPLRLGGMSPARLGGFSPARFGGTSPARFGGMSPARAAAVDLSTRDLPPKKHKHKVKHKKKHKEERRHKSPEDNKSLSKDIKDNLPDTTDHDVPIENITPDVEWNTSEVGESHLESLSRSALNQVSHSSQPGANAGMPIQSSRHKLSISIKRVSNASYVACDSSHSDGERTVTPTVPSGNEDDIIEEAQGIAFNEQESVSTAPKDMSQNVDSEKEAPIELALSFNEENNRTVKPVDDSSQNYPLLSEPAYCVNTPDSLMLGSDSPGSDEACSGAIPNFPSRAPMEGFEDHASAALLMKFSWQEVEKCELAEGRIMNVGDVVWGKIHGFPWWPAKVKAIRELREGGGDAKWQQAHVSWYGSSTSSLMPANTLQPFLQMFKIRHNKRKRGPYREAIKQATCEAEQLSSLNPPHDFQQWHPPQQQPPIQTQPLPPQQQQQHQTPENLLGASPREVDVVS